VGFQFLLEECHAGGVIRVGENVDSMYGDLGPCFLGLHGGGGVVKSLQGGLEDLLVFEYGGGRAVLTGGKDVFVLSVDRGSADYGIGWCLRVSEGGDEGVSDRQGVRRRLVIVGPIDGDSPLPFGDAVFAVLLGGGFLGSRFG